MRCTEATTLRDRLSIERRLFVYFPDRYALVRLARFVGNGMAVREVRASALGRMLDRPAVKQVVSRCGGVLTAEALSYAWPGRVDTYSLSFGTWRVVQTTRKGFNLVVHLDLPKGWDRLVVKDPGEERPVLGYHGHPHAEDALTFAWARVDLDLEHGEALIEEIQSDAARDGRSGVMWSDSAKVLKRLPRSVYDTWADATLAATLEVLELELGIRTVWFHTHDGGRVAKSISGRAPPRSLYTDLPRRFGFVEVDEQPAMIGDLHRRDRNRLAGVRFQRLAA